MRHVHAFGQTASDSLGDAEIDHLGQGGNAVRRDENIRRLEIPVDDGLLVSVVHRRADLKEELKPCRDRKMVGVTELGDFLPIHEFHDKERTTIRGASSLVDPSDIRMIHESNSLLLGPKTREDLIGVHPALN